jgi:hypothetical protein
LETIKRVITLTPAVVVAVVVVVVVVVAEVHFLTDQKSFPAEKRNFFFHF